MLAQKQKLTLIEFTQQLEKGSYLLIDYADIDILKLFITEQGKILPRRATGLTVQQQRKIAKAIKQARIFSLLPFVTSNEL